MAIDCPAERRGYRNTKKRVRRVRIDYVVCMDFGEEFSVGQRTPIPDSSAMARRSLHHRRSKNHADAQRLEEARRRKSKPAPTAGDPRQLEVRDRHVIDGTSRPCRPRSRDHARGWLKVLVTIFERRRRQLGRFDQVEK